MAAAMAVAVAGGSQGPPQSYTAQQSSPHVGGLLRGDAEVGSEGEEKGRGRWGREGLAFYQGPQRMRIGRVLCTVAAVATVLT